MTGEEAAADTLGRKLGFQVRAVGLGDRGYLEHVTVDEDDKVVARSCRPVHKQEIDMWKLLIELQMKIDVLELPA